MTETLVAGVPNVRAGGIVCASCYGGGSTASTSARSCKDLPHHGTAGSTRRQNRGKQHRRALTLGSVARRDNARAQVEAVIEVLRCVHEQMVALQRGLHDGNDVESGGQRFVDVAKTQMWLQFAESNG